MAKGKLILICQSGGKFETNDDGTLSYTEGEANAININDETKFNDLKLKLAEMCNLDYNSVSIKYFLPGNKRNLIILKNDKDLKRLVDYHGNSVTADIFVSGREGFDRVVFNIYDSRRGDIQLAETVNCAVATIAKSSPGNVANSDGRIVAPSHSSTPATPADSVVAVNATAQSPSEATTDTAPSDDGVDYDSDYAPRSIIPTGAIPTDIDTRCTPADAVKNRRRSAFWKFGANGPTIVSVPDDAQKRISRKRNRAIPDDAQERRSRNRNRADPDDAQERRSRNRNRVVPDDALERRSRNRNRADPDDAQERRSRNRTRVVPDDALERISRKRNRAVPDDAQERRSRKRNRAVPDDTQKRGSLKRNRTVPDDAQKRGSLKRNRTVPDDAQKRGSRKRNRTVSDNAQKRRSRKRNIRSHSFVAVADNIEHKRDIISRKMYFDSPSSKGISDDDSLEKQVASWKDGITGVGQEFKSVNEFRDALQKYAIAHRFVYRLKKSDSSRASGRCVAEGCSWKIHASWVPSDHSFKIKKLNDSHTCGGQSWKSANPGKNWLVGIIKGRLRDSPHLKPREIANSIFRDFGLELNYTQVWRRMEEAREQLQGSYKEAYDQLPSFCEKMVETNPGSFANLVTNDDKRFQRLFVCFHATLHGFLKGCRPLLFLEAASFKSKYQESLLTATALDGDDGLFPVAFAIIDDENDDNWHWFLEQLKSAVSTPQSITFVSDREKNLKKAVLEVFENAHFGYSMYNLMESFFENLKAPFHGDGKVSLPINFVAAANAVRYSGFMNYIGKIKQVSSEAYNWVMQIEPEHWTSLYFTGEPYNHITQDVAKLYTKLMDEVREKPIIQKIEALRYMMSELRNSRRMDSSNWSTKLTPSKEKELEEETLKARGLKVLISSDTLFEVHDDSTHVVNINNCDCTCLEWKRSGLPCHHAIAVFKRIGKSVYDYCPKYFTADSFHLTYSEPINPVPSIGVPVEKEEADSDKVLVLPPCPLRPPSQPKKERTKKVEANKRTVFCSRCKAAGHNKSTCRVVVDNAGLSHDSSKAIEVQSCDMDSDNNLYTVEVQPCKMDDIVSSFGNRDVVEALPREVDNAGSSYGNLYTAEVKPCEMESQGNLYTVEVQPWEIENAVWSHSNSDDVEVQPCNVGNVGSSHCNPDAVEVQPCEVDTTGLSHGNTNAVEVQPCEMDDAVSRRSNSDGVDVQPCNVDNIDSSHSNLDAVEVQLGEVDNAGLSHHHPNDVEAKPCQVDDSGLCQGNPDAAEVQPGEVDNAGLSHHQPNDVEAKPCQVDDSGSSQGNPNAAEVQPGEVDIVGLSHHQPNDVEVEPCQVDNSGSSQGNLPLPE